MLLMEVARRRLMTEGARKGFRKNETIVIEQEELVDGITYLRQFRPSLIRGFEEGLFNTFVMGPFGLRLATERNIPRGTLKIKSQKSVIRLNRSEIRPPSAKDVDITKIGEVELMTPKCHRFVDPRFITLSASEELRTMGISPDNLQDLRRNGSLDRILSESASIGVNLVFGTYGEQAGIEAIRVIPDGIKRKWKREFTDR